MAAVYPLVKNQLLHNADVRQRGENHFLVAAAGEGSVLEVSEEEDADFGLHLNQMLKATCKLKI